MSVNVKSKTKKLKSKFSKEFERYIKRQRLRTTFNGLEVQNFSWYKKTLGLV